MANFFEKLFSKDVKNKDSDEFRQRCGSLTSGVGIAANLLLCAGKLVAGTLTGAVSMTADALNNLSDAASQCISLVSFRLASKPADRDHPFGHARIEYVASMIVSFIIMLVGFELLKSSVDKIVNPATTEFEVVSTVILAVSVLIKVGLFFLNRFVGKRIDSGVIKATAVDSLSDAGATTAVLISALILKFTGVDIDAYMGIAVSVVIMVAGVKILNETKNVILGEAPCEDLVESIKSLVSEYPVALGIHDLMVHNYGAGKAVASLHVEVDGGEDIYKIHDVIDNIEKHLKTELGIDATIHIDPIVTNDTEVDYFRQRTIALVREIDSLWKIHDFRLVKGETHNNLIFDVAVPFECKLKNDEIKSLISEKIKEIGENCYTVLTIDKE